MRLLKTSLSVLVAAAVTACGTLEPNVIETPASTVTPLITSAGKVTSAGNATSGTPVANAGSAAGSKAVLSSGSGSIQEIFRTDRCSDLSRGGFIWFTETVGLNDWLSPLSPELMAQIRSRVDFAKQGALLVDYGIAGTGGAAATVSGSLERKGDEAIVKVERYEPSPTDRKKRAQVVTHPCSLHVISRTGFDTLVIQSEQGDRLTSFANK